MFVSLQLEAAVLSVEVSSQRNLWANSAEQTYL
jgi:hypothetical protein